MNGINLWKRIHLLNSDVVELKIRISKLVLVDVFFGKKKIKIREPNASVSYNKIYKTFETINWRESDRKRPCRNSL